MQKQIEIHVVEASDVEARVELQYRGEPVAGAELSGTISGPRREASRTLPASVRLQSLHGSSVPAAGAVLPDPCFWSPELPFLYDVSLELRRGNDVVDSTQFSIALHPKSAVKQ